MRPPPLGRTGRQWRLARVCPRTALLRNFVGELCRNRPFSTELRQSVSTKIDDKVGNESFGTSSTYEPLVEDQFFVTYFTRYCPPRFMVQMRAQSEWRLRMNILPLVVHELRLAGRRPGA